MKFSDALASSVHDIKNSLSMVLHTLDDLLDDPETRISDPRKANILQLEARRANDNLIQLLSLYKLESQQLTPDLQEHNTRDFLDEVLAENGTLMDSLGVEIACECDAWSSGYFDENLVRGVLNSAIGNAERYTQDKILLSAASDGNWLVFRVEDDGDGFPAEMLKAQQATQHSDALSSGHTQLGLFFASEVARLHCNGDRQGYISLKNQHALKGGCFELWLP